MSKTLFKKELAKMDREQLAGLLLEAYEKPGRRHGSISSSF